MSLLNWDLDGQKSIAKGSKKARASEAEVSA